MFERLTNYLQESRREFKRINWPTFIETRKLTFIVIGFSLGLAAFLGVLDFGFTRVLEIFIIG
ncbi:MAG: preprotein translocase subunit SecE [Candidatus Harrisonbacteria bacterium CG10_big_fil_rev_8_21_14_0_10_40_38]|uniref:Protein translocase subunit SecE n=1 Tax=Candidatus Harrisonbacteria bacterium CG10_big_fil_rev_8_21_14_0_10_40_38 TaxID=1974583 RepID=A0A2H0UV65_9BACT|nr:MAG: preprotein translocase subunit SecE [Candidatus Harrisonbacteria bacterium CG10_big_fil_rev_8_21_14_0_10_40_38]